MGRHPHAGAAASERARQWRRRLLPRQALQPARQPALHRPHPASWPGACRPASRDRGRSAMAGGAGSPRRQPAEPKHAAHGRTAESARRPALRSGRPEDAAEPCQQQGSTLPLLCERRSRRRQRRHRRYRLADSCARDRGRGRQRRGARLREPGFLSELLHFSQSASEASTRLIGRISELADRLGAPASTAGREAMQLLITRSSCHGPKCGPR